MNVQSGLNVTYISAFFPFWFSDVATFTEKQKWNLCFFSEPLRIISIRADMYSLPVSFQLASICFVSP